ncbi:MAG TPA: hypothetical protein DCW74_05520 [Alteromonas australica]|jgi:hypothetical protein|uniref:Uncharacterized protein n=1 Tax=Alteromonas australica TaxID=589873 RepID=A0A075P5M2_9ALTE|nr:MULTISPECIES: hypothetical protein [Alteromonas]MAB94137.1 hypothetical protein [Alteromonas sp.]AIG00231.1 hypothetical protein EP13_16955 [Alteromonas australica]AJP45191.1 hypothetical protein EP12_17700 [Alteromonas australica]MAF70414.1 hypothetical protein [Alteromonas sp.]MAO30297.1 hypothetical protein [Alteromonas sp.]|tara:strand:- start:5197 stop:5391 length:195 start_codon:yes stop_codon:yes gene_type:complete
MNHSNTTGMQVLNEASIQQVSGGYTRAVGVANVNPPLFVVTYPVTHIYDRDSRHGSGYFFDKNL